MRLYGVYMAYYGVYMAVYIVGYAVMAYGIGVWLCVGCGVWVALWWCVQALCRRGLSVGYGVYVW